MRPALGLSIIALGIIAGVTIGPGHSAAAREADSKAPAAKVAKGKKGGDASHTVPAGVTLNACGCYRTDKGACFCGNKNGPCTCPGDCEPLACEPKRSKEMQREIAAETKRAQDEEKKRLDEERKRQEAEAAAQAAAAQPDASTMTSEEAESADQADGDKKADEPTKADKRGTRKARKQRAAVSKP